MNEEQKWKCPKCNTVTLKNGRCPPNCKACMYFPTEEIK